MGYIPLTDCHEYRDKNYKEILGKAGLNTGVALFHKDDDPTTFKNALEMGSGAAPIILRTDLDEFIQDLLLFDNPLLNEIPSDPGSGSGYTNQLRAETGDDWEDAFVLDTTDMSALENTGTYSSQEFLFKIICRQLKISFPLELKNVPAGQLRNAEIRGQMEEIKKFLIKSFFFGDKSYGSGQVYDGLINLCGDTRFVHNSATPNGGPLDLDKYDEAFDLIKPNKPDAIMTTIQGVRALGRQVRDKENFYVDDNDAGFRIYYYEGIPILDNYYIGNTMAYNGTNVTSWSTGGNTTAFFFVKWSSVRWVDLFPISYFDLARATILYNAAQLFGMRTLKCEQPEGLSILDGVSILKTA